MKRAATIFALALTLGACESTNPIFGDGSGGGVTPDVPPVDNTIQAALAGNIVALGYDASSDQLTIEMSGLDNDKVVSNYDRAPQLDLPGYKAFVSQDDPLDRMFTALAATSFDGSVTAGVAADGGQFTKYFPGGYYGRNAPYVAPNRQGLTSYAGKYAAVSNVNAPGANLLPVPPGTNPALLPHESARIAGDIFLNVQFGENKVNGAVYNRRWVDSSAQLDTIFLLPESISTDGDFAGSVALSDQKVIGSYGGVFGGNGATAVAGVISIADFDPSRLNEEERGVFVLTRCGLPGEDAANCSVAEDFGQ